MAQIEYFADLDLMENQIRNAIQQTVKTLPTLKEGMIVYLSEEDKSTPEAPKSPGFYIGTAGGWQKVTTEDPKGGVYVSTSDFSDYKTTQAETDRVQSAAIATKAEKTSLDAVQKTAEAAVTPAEQTEALRPYAKTVDVVLNSEISSVLEESATKVPSTKLVKDQLASKADASTTTSALAGKVPTSRTIAGEALTGDITKGTLRTALDIANVDNTADTAKPVSTAQQTALDKKANFSVISTGKSEGVATINTPIPSVTKMEEYVADKVSSTYKVKGSVANLAALKAVKSPAVGDVYNVIAAVEDIDLGNHPAGTNFVWAEGKWDALGGTINLKDYYTKTEAKEAFVESIGAVTGGTFTKVTVDAQGLVSAGVEKLVAGDIPELAASKVTSGEFDLARIPTITKAKIGADSVDGTKIADNAIGNEHIATNAVQEAQIKDGAVTDVKIVQVAASKVNGTLAVGNIPDLGADKITSGRLVADRLPTDVVYKTTAVAVPAETSPGKAIRIAHGLGRMPVAVELFKVADGSVCYTQMQKDDTYITLTFNKAVGAGIFKVSFI